MVINNVENSYINIFDDIRVCVIFPPNRIFDSFRFFKHFSRNKEEIFLLQITKDKIW